VGRGISQTHDNAETLIFIVQRKSKVVGFIAKTELQLLKTAICDFKW
jgi:hypothetical protein